MATACGALSDGQTLGDLSLTIVLYGKDKAVIDREIADFATVFTNADGSLFPETYNQLNALFAVVPGNYAQNLRKMYMLLSNYADLVIFLHHPARRKAQPASRDGVPGRHGDGQRHTLLPQPP